MRVSVMCLGLASVLLVGSCKKSEADVEISPSRPTPPVEPLAQCIDVCSRVQQRMGSCVRDTTASWPANFRNLVQSLLQEQMKTPCDADCAFWAPQEVERVHGCVQKQTCAELEDCLSSGSVVSPSPPPKTRLRDKDGATMVMVPEGEFLRGSPDGLGMDDEHPMRKIMLSAFWIDRTEVTAGQYLKCVEERACSQAGTDVLCNFRKAGREEHPINCVSWYDADKYCTWAGAALPSEAQWEKAARGPHGRFFPWGWYFLSCDKLVWNDPDKGGGCGQRRDWAVGSKPAGASPYGAMDMAGNLWEWVADSYDPGYYARSPDRDPVYATKGTMGVARGGGYGNDLWEGWRTANRFKFMKLHRIEGFGFRCAMQS
jgi:formylglycine-generating enzyme required for sulfatase activity